MKRSTVIVFLLGLGALALGLALPRVMRVPPSQATRLGSLHAERNALAASDDATLERLRREVASTAKAAWTLKQVSSWAGEVGPRWRVRSGDQPGLCIVEREQDHAGDWPPFLAALQEWAQLPGITLASVEVAAAGSAGARRFTRRSVTLRFELQAPPPSSNPSNNP